MILFNFRPKQVLAPRENAESDAIFRHPERVLTGTGMNHGIQHLRSNQVRYQLEQQTTAMTTWDVVASCFQIVSVARQNIRGNKAVFEDDYSCIQNKDGNRAELGRKGTQQVVMQHGQCLQASSGGSSRAD